MAESAATEWIEKTYVPWTVTGGEASGRITPKAADVAERWNQEALKSGTCYTVFCAPLPDVFENRSELIPLRNDLWRLIKRTPFLNWMVLTRCIGNASGMLPADWGTGYDNVCLMVVVENQRHFDERVPLLQKIPVKYRALLIEPLTGALQIPIGSLKGIDLVIVGGGVGKGACPMNPDWVRHVRDACAREAISFSFRQWGSWTPDRSRRNADLSNGAVFTAYNAKPVLLSTLGAVKEREDLLKEPGAQAVFYVRNKKENDNLLDGREYNARIPFSRFGANTGLAAVIPSLSAQEQADFSKLETIVTKGLIDFWKAGEALREIRDRGLYRGSYPNFEAYCRTKWEMSRAEAYRQIGAAEVIGDICTDGSVRLLPENLAQSRPLFSLKNPAQRRQAWNNVIERSKDENLPISAHIVTEEVLKLKGGTDVGRKRKSAAKPKTVDPVAVNKALKAVEQAFGATTPAEVRHALRRIQGTVGFLRGKCAVFCDTKGVFGGLSNMAGGYAVSVNGITFRTVEALYQACRYPDHSDVQDKIIHQNSPLTAKRIARGKQTMEKCRSDWDDIKVEVMRWCLKIKLLQHEEKFGALLLSTGSLSIVEESAKDNFWGAIPLAGNNTVLKGQNVLGELLEDLREQVQQGIVLRAVEPPLITNFLIMDKEVDAVVSSQRQSAKC